MKTPTGPVLSQQGPAGHQLVYAVAAAAVAAALCQGWTAAFRTPESAPWDAPFFEGRPAGCWAALLGDPDPSVSGQAVEGLARGGARAVPVLLDVARGGNPAAASRAALLLARLEPGQASAAVPALLGALRSPEREDRRRAAHALGLIGPEAKVAVPALRAALADGDGRAQVWAAWALWKVDGREAGPARSALVRARNHPDVLVRMLAADALQGLTRGDPPPRTAAPVRKRRPPPV